MKTRNGFVSNSSSSSFIVAVSKNNKNTSAKITITLEVDLAKYGTTIETVEELIKYFCKEMYVDIDKLKQHKDYIACKRAIESGKVVIMGDFSSESGEVIETMLCEKGLDGIVGDNVEVIQSEGGY